MMFVDCWARWMDGSTYDLSIGVVTVMPACLPAHLYVYSHGILQTTALYYLIA